MHRGVPNQDDSFTIEVLPEQADLLLLLKMFQVDGETPYVWEYHTYDVKQAAIWIVTDNANYSDLGTLVRSSSLGGFQVRAITEEEAARAMQLVDQAGLDITQTAIWQDRARIISGIEDDPDLVSWLSERGTE
jgi:hypothetical protein